MRHVDHRLADLVLDALQLGPHVGAERRVEVRERLVEQEDRRLDDHAAPERDLLQVVDREARRPSVERRGEPDRLGDLLHLALDLVLRAARGLRTRRPNARFSCDGHVREDRVVLEHEADVALPGRQVADRVAVEVHLAARRRLEAGDHVHGRRLAAAGGPEQRDERAVAAIEIEVLDGLHVAEVLRQAFEPDLRHALTA